MRMKSNVVFLITQIPPCHIMKITNYTIVRENIRLIYSIDVNLYTKDDVYARMIVVGKRLAATDQ